MSDCVIERARVNEKKNVRMRVGEKKDINRSTHDGTD